MSWIARIAAAALALAVAPRVCEAQVRLSEPSAARPAVRLDLHSLLGVGSSNFPVEAFPEVQGQAILTSFDAALRIHTDITVGLRLAAALTSIEQPAGSYVDQAAIGNVELYVEQTQALRGLPLPSSLVLGVAVGVPVAQQGPPQSLMASRALAVARALETSARALYTPGVLPLVPSAQLEVRYARLTLSALLDIPVLVRVSRAELPLDQTFPVGIYPDLGLHAGLAIFDWLAVTLRAHALLDVARETRVPTNGAPDRRVQFALAPGLAFPGKFASVYPGCSVALGGDARGSVGCGVDVRLDF